MQKKKIAFINSLRLVWYCHVFVSLCRHSCYPPVMSLPQGRLWRFTEHGSCKTSLFSWRSLLNHLKAKSLCQFLSLFHQSLMANRYGWNNGKHSDFILFACSCSWEAGYRKPVPCPSRPLLKGSTGKPAFNQPKHPIGLWWGLSKLPGGLSQLPAELLQHNLDFYAAREISSQWFYAFGRESTCFS